MNSGIKRREKLSKDEVCKIGKDIKKELCWQFWISTKKSSDMGQLVTRQNMEAPQLLQLLSHWSLGTVEGKRKNFHISYQRE
jgi:hypothetical protein